MFKKKEKSDKFMVEFVNRFKPILVKIDKEKLEVCYINNENITPVKTGKIPLKKGYYIKRHGEKLSQINPNVEVFSDFFNAFCSIG
jgi:hypothetical protein